MIRWRRAKHLAPGQADDLPVDRPGTDNEIAEAVDSRANAPGWRRLLARSRAGNHAAESTGDDQVWMVVGQRFTARLGNAALLLAVAAGPVGLITAMADRGPAPIAGGNDPGSDGRTARAGEFAVRMVEAWLTATRSRPGRLPDYVDDDLLTGLPERGWRVAGTAVADVTATDEPTVWSVTVSADVEGQIRYFRIPIRITDRGSSALTLPAAAPPPAVAGRGGLAYGSTISLAGPAGKAVGGFLAAMLTGSGEISRYTAPGAPIRAVTPAPSERVRMSALLGAQDEPVAEDGAQLRVLADLAVIDAQKRRTAMQYALTLAARGGRWEVAAVDLAPALPTTKQTPTSPAGPGGESTSAR